MVISIHQPAYLPWLGYFDKILRSDIFIYLDTVQLEKNSFTCRNKIKTPQGDAWLTVPLKMQGHTSAVIKDMWIDNSQQWKKKHLKNIFFNYKKASFFHELYHKLESLYAQNFDLFSDLAYHHLLFWMQELNVKTTVFKSSDLDVGGSKSDLILNLCTNFHATTYLSGALGKSYLEESSFVEHKIKIQYQNYQHPFYSQLHGPFLQSMSILDFWMNSHQVNLIRGVNK